MIEDLARRAGVAIETARLQLSVQAARGETEAAISAADDAGRRKSEFLATMSHEFRTPLNAILGYAQLLDMGVLGPTTTAQNAHLERLQASARHLLQLVDDVLDVAKVDADRLDVRHDILMTGSAVVAASALVHPQATAKGIRMYDLNANAPGAPYSGDERRVRQILVNLFSNAVKFTPPAGEVTIICGATNEPDPGVHLAVGQSAPDPSEVPSARRAWAYVRVTDSGPGISPQFMSRLFEPFVQADSALTREKGGSGLGLAISRRLARRMGGDITVRSKPGSGAIFTLWLPTPEEDADGGGRSFRWWIRRVARLRPHSPFTPPIARGSTTTRMQFSTPSALACRSMQRRSPNATSQRCAKMTDSPALASCAGCSSAITRRHSSDSWLRSSPSSAKREARIRTCSATVDTCSG